MDYKPLINYSQKHRQSNMVAAYRLFSVVVVVGFIAGLYWRLS